MLHFLFRSVYFRAPMFSVRVSIGGLLAGQQSACSHTNKVTPHSKQHTNT